MSKLKILAIGNSFSVDAMEHIFKVALAYGYKQEDIILGNLYIGGCSLKTHHENMKGDLPRYGYYKNINNEWVIPPETTLLTGVLDEEWDYITMQQVSQNSGQPDTFEPYLSELIEYVNSKKLNPSAKLLWHSTWSYAKDSTHGGFANYGNDQQAMYSAILDAAKHIKANYPAFSDIIPSSVAITNARKELGDNLNRDGFHLDLTYGRLTAALTWFYKITGVAPDNIIDETPLLEICKNGVVTLKEKGVDITPEKLLEISINAAKDAVEKPLAPIIE